MIRASISCDGAALLSGSFIGQNQSYSQHLFTDDRAVLSRDLSFSGPVESTISVLGIIPPDTDSLHDFSHPDIHQPG